MATYTSHYNLKKPATSDKIRIADFNGNADTIDATMYDNATLGAQLKADIGIVENTNTATHNISAGQYVIWKGALYTASSAISSGATLSDANLTAVSGGGLNALNSKMTAGNWTVLNSTYGISYMKVSGILFVQCVYNGSDIPSSVLGTLPSGFRPKTDCRARNYTGNGNLAVYANGEVRVNSTDWVNCTLVAPCAE